MLFEKILIYFLQGKKIRKEKWQEGEFIYQVDGQIKDQNNEDVGYVFTIDDMLDKWEFAPDQYCNFKTAMDDMKNNPEALYKDTEDDSNNWIKYYANFNCFIDDTDHEVLLSAKNIYSEKWIKVDICTDKEGWKTIV